MLHPTWAQAHPTLPTPTRMADPVLQHFGAVEDDEDDPYQGILQRRPRSPWVAVGAGLTASVLVAGLAAFRRGDRRMSQLMMRARVLAQVGGARAGGQGCRWWRRAGGGSAVACAALLAVACGVVHYLRPHTFAALAVHCTCAGCACRPNCGAWGAAGGDSADHGGDLGCCQWRRPAQLCRAR